MAGGGWQHIATSAKEIAGAAGAKTKAAAAAAATKVVSGLPAQTGWWLDSRARECTGDMAQHVCAATQGPALAAAGWRCSNRPPDAQPPLGRSCCLVAHP